MVFGKVLRNGLEVVGLMRLTLPLRVAGFDLAQKAASSKAAHCSTCDSLACRHDGRRLTRLWANERQRNCFDAGIHDEQVHRARHPDQCLVAFAGRLSPFAPGEGSAMVAA